MITNSNELDQRIAAVEASRGDEEIAHVLEDDLMREFIQAVSDGCGEDPFSSWADKVLACVNTPMSRWYV